CDASDEAYHRFLARRRLIERRCLFFRRSADLANHDDRLRLVIGKEHLKNVDMLGALYRIAANSDASRLPETGQRRLMDRFIGKSARAGNNTDGAALVDMARHDADLAFAGRDDPWAVRPDEPGLRSIERALHLHHIHYRNAFGDRYNQRDLSVDGLE